MTVEQLPFKITDVQFGLKEVEGLLKLNSKQNSLLFEYREKDSVIGILESKIKERTVPIAEIHKAELKSRLFSHQLVIHAKSLKAFDQLPGTNHGSLTLKIKKRDRNIAERFISYVNLEISEQNLRELDS